MTPQRGGIHTRGLTVVTEMGEEDTRDTTGRQAEVSGDKANDRRTYGAAIEVPEMVFFEIGESIQAEVTSTPRNQTGKNIRKGGNLVWRETYHQAIYQNWRSQPWSR